MRPRAPNHVLRLLQQGDPLARIREKLADAVEIADELEDDGLRELLSSAVSEVDSALGEATDKEDDVESTTEANNRPQSSEYRSRQAFEAAMEEWRHNEARRDGPAIRRGKPPRIVTREPNED